jgi:glucose/arabinose dehydrogenase
MLLACCALACSPATAQELSTREAVVALGRVEVPHSDEAGLERLVTGLRAPWSLAFLPDGGMLVSEKPLGVRLIRGGKPATQVLPGGPTDFYARADSGVLDVVLDPDFAQNRFVYITYAQGTEAANRTAIWKARLDGDRLTGGRVIFRTGFDKKGPSHPGGRLLFLPDKTMLLSVGDGFEYKAEAQNMRSHLGKVLRLTREGGVPADNPFVGRAGAKPEVFTLGHRSTLGLATHPGTGKVWQVEMGPNGGDEVNILEPGGNYGWPLVSFGRTYPGPRQSQQFQGDGFIDPVVFWVPSISTSGLAFYTGSALPKWRGDIFVGGMRYGEIPNTGRLERILINENLEELRREPLLVDLRQRIRDVRQGPDGLLYLLTDYAENASLLRIAPVE